MPTATWFTKKPATFVGLTMLKKLDFNNRFNPGNASKKANPYVSSKDKNNKIKEFKRW